MAKRTKTDPLKLTVSISGPPADVIAALINGLDAETLVKLSAELERQLPIVTLRQRPVSPKKRPGR